MNFLVQEFFDVLPVCPSSPSSPSLPSHRGVYEYSNGSNCFPHVIKLTLYWLVCVDGFNLHVKRVQFKRIISVAVTEKGSRVSTSF